jgi:cytochrome d ubiquinol oxidase subunit II
VSVAEAVMAVLFVGLSAYAVLAGADFGAGFWDLFAGSATGGREPRELIEHSIGPVWEANHVWLIFALVVLWTGFPTAFGAIMSTLYLPLTLAAIGVILRGSAFAFRKVSTNLELQRAFGATFALSSVITPFCLGAVAGGIATGRVPTGEETGDVITSWLNPSGILGGVLAVVVCAFLAATYLTADAHHQRDERLERYFRTRALATGVLAGVIALAGVWILHEDASKLFDGLTGRGLPLVVVSALAGLAALVLLWRNHPQMARVAAALAVVAVLWGWAAGQYPYVLEGRLKIEDAAGAHATLVSLLACIGAGAVLLVPSLAYLFFLAQKGELAGEPGETPGAG